MREKNYFRDRCVTISNKPICFTIAKFSCFGIEILNWINKNIILLSRDKKEKEGMKRLSVKVTRNREKEKAREKKKLKSEKERELEKAKCNKI